MPNCNKPHHQSGQRSDETMDDDSDDKDSKRKSRNLSEKKRRDQFNLLVNELSAMVSTSGRKMDKSTVLKATISFLKSHNELAVRSKINEIQEDWKPTFLTNEEFTHLVLEAVDGFIIIFSTSGQIYYASESTTSLLGYLPKDILDISIFDLVCEEDHSYLYDILATPHLDEQISFSCHLKRCWSQFEKATFFELVNIFGYFRPDENTTNKVSADTPSSSSSSDSNKNLVFVGTAKIQTPLLIKEMPLIDSIIRSEFTSRHSLEWKFLFLDHRAPPIIGYLPFELLGTSGYEYYHVDDLEKVINCHEKLMQKGEGTSCYYRFLTKGQQWIWLQTRFYITYHQWNSKPEFVVCTHRVVSYLDVKNKSRKDSSVHHHHHHHHHHQSSSIKDDVETHHQSSSAAWRSSSSRNRRNSTKKRQNSDCTSMSADSPTSKYSTVTEKSIKPSLSLLGNLSVSSSPHLSSQEANLSKSHESLNSPTGGVGILHQPQQEQQFLEPAQQYRTTINNNSLQPSSSSSSSALESYSAHSLSTQVETVQNVEFQADFQRKQAELQAIIGQQQQELLRVSEQLLMARLALFQQQTQEQISPQTGEQSYQPSNSPATVSSTTATSSASINLPTVSIAETDPLQQPTVLYTLSDSISNNTQN